MGQEIELKLSIEPADVDRLFRHPFIVRHAMGPAVSKHLVNHYFDTPEQTLRQNGMALRIRFDGSAYIQTLKQKGGSREGLTIRGEWEWPVGGPNIDPCLVPVDIWPPELKDCQNRLVPLFRTDFKRTALPLQMHSESRKDPWKQTRVEMALDRGIITTDIGHGPAVGEEILEVEFELLAGDAGWLLEIPKRLGPEIRLTPCNISKAARGYRLLRSV